MNTSTAVNKVTKTKTAKVVVPRGRPAMELPIPKDKPFTITKLHEHMVKRNQNITRVQLSNRVKAMQLNGIVKIIETVPTKGGKGRPTRVFKYTTPEEMKNEKRRARSNEAKRVAKKNKELVPV